MTSATQAAFERNLREWSDIQGHVQRLYDLVIELNAQEVLELGVRDAVSTSAFLAALDRTDGHLYSVDVNVPQHKINEYDDPRWSFFQDFSTAPTVVGLYSLPIKFDIVFVDTDHTYELTKQEIETWSPRVRPGGAMAFHDTNLERFDHHITEQPPYPVRTAIDEWLAATGLSLTTDFFPESYGMTIVRFK